MKKKKVVALTVAVFLVTLSVPLICYVSFVHILGDCFWWECAPKRNFHVLDWELPVYLFPNNATVRHINTPSEGTGEIEGGFQSMFWENGTAAYDIKRHSMNRNAINEFKFDVEHMVDSDTKKAWLPPEEITFVSAVADEIYIACGNRMQGKHCAVTVRYQEYVIYFSSTIDNKMTYVGFERIIKYIDEQISSRLYP